jgi:ankyrin repeat protein
LHIPPFKDGLVVAPLLGLCVHGRLKLFTEGASTNHCFDFEYQDEFSDDSGAIGRMRNCCRSTRTLNSRSSESLKGTGHWLLDSQEYVEWRNQGSNLLWVSGKSGAGKSVLMSTVIHDLQVNRRDGELVAYFFADGYYQGTGTASAILRAMLGRLLSNSTGDLLRDLKPLLKDIITAGIHLSATRMKCFMSKIRHKLRPDETLYLLLDGLDEVNQSPYEQGLLLKLIEHASHYDPNHRIKCFVSSRRSFFGDNFPKGALRVDLDAHPFTRMDMSLYVKDSLKNAKLAYSSREVEDLAERLLNSASGSFLVLRLILEANMWSTEESNPRLGHFPSNWEGTNAHSLPDVYRQMLGGVDDSNKEAALSMLRWVTYVARPLDSDELLDALYEQCGIKVKKEDIISISAGLLSISGTQILFTHLSVREYLESQLSSKWEEISDEANEMIAHACLKLLRPENLLQSLRLPTRKSPDANKSLRYHQSILPYAQAYWIYHYRRAEQRSSYLAGFLHDFLEESLLRDSENLDSNNEGEVQAPGRIVDFLGGLQVSNSFNSVDLVNTALRVGARFGFSKLVKLELDMGANPNMISGPERQTALSWAAKCGHLDIVQLLLQRGADPNLTSGSGKTPLIYAMINGHFDVLDVLMTFASNTLQRAQFPNPAVLGDGAIPISQNDFQELSLTVVISSSCTVCEEMQIDWQVSLHKQTRGES